MVADLAGVTPGLDLTEALDVGAGVAVDHHVRQVDPDPFSGAKPPRKDLWANSRRFPANSRIFSTAWSWVTLNGSTASGTAPLGICSLMVSTWRHQWQRDDIASAVLTTTSEPHPAHFRVIIPETSGEMSEAPEAIVVPTSSVSGTSPEIIASI